MVTRLLERRSLREFALAVHPRFEVARHHAYLFDLIDSWLDTEGGDHLAISMPPRHSKSIIGSVLVPAFYLGRHPDRDIIHSSYAALLTNDFSRKVREVVRSAEYQRIFPGTGVSADKAAVTNWRTTRGGGMLSVGAGGGVTGHGAHLYIIDDIHKEGDQLSPVTLAQTIAWYTSAARTRLMPEGKMLLIGTRWSPGDLFGFVEEAARQGGDRWRFVRLAALAGPDDPLGRAEGEALWPEWFPASALELLRALDPAIFDSLYQQQPRSDTTVTFKRESMQVIERLPRSAAGAWCFDLALGKTEQADFCAWARVSEIDGALYFDHLALVRAPWPMVRLMILGILDEFQEDDFVFPSNLLELLAVQELKAERPRRRVFAALMAGDKVARAQPYAARAAAGQVYLVQGPNLDVWIRQHELFGSGVEHDDAVDVGSLACHWFFRRAWFEAKEEMEAVAGRWKNLSEGL
jgi:hypothetical protein